MLPMIVILINDVARENLDIEIMTHWQGDGL
jgi:hypothetical protein